MQATKARAILAQAKSTESYEGPIPEDDDKAISEAQDLVEMATVAWEQNVRGPAVEAILRLAAEDFDGKELPQNGKTADEIREQRPPNKKTLEDDEVKTTTVERELLESPPDSEPEAATVEGEEEPLTHPEVGDDELRTTEPWEGYDNDKVPQVIEALEIGLDADDDPEGLLAHVTAYETAHKNRIRILKRLEEFTERLKEPKPEPPRVPKEEIERLKESVQEAPERRADEEGAQEFAQRFPHADERGKREPSPELIAALKDAEDPAGGRTGNEIMEAAHEAAKQDGHADELDYADLVTEVEDELQRNRLHVPEPPTEDAPKVPYDYSKVSDAELRSLHSIFSSFAYRTNYLLMRDERIALALKMQADEIHRELLVAIAKYDDHGKEKKVAHIEAEIESTPALKKLRRAQRKHEIYATAHRQERDSYNKLVEAMSRLETMRMNEHERTRR